MNNFICTGVKYNVYIVRGVYVNKTNYTMISVIKIYTIVIHYFYSVKQAVEFVISIRYTEYC